LRDLQL